MNDSPAPPPANAPPRRKMRPIARILLLGAGSLAGILLILVTAALLILPSEWFRDKVRSRIVTEAERVSGGRVEIGSFRFDWTNLVAEVAPFVLHGTEPSGEAPLFRAESVKVGLKIISIFKRDIDISSLHLDQPRANVLVDRDGATNFPAPKLKRESRDPIEQLLVLAVDEIVLRNGELRYGDRKLPLDLHGKAVDAKLAYDFRTPAYRGSLSAEEMRVDSGFAEPLTVSLHTALALLKNKVEIQQGRLAMKNSSIELQGTIEDFQNLRAAFEVKAAGDLVELGRPFRLPQPHTGTVHFNGKVLYTVAESIQIRGRVTGQHLALRQDRVDLKNISLASDLQFQNRQIRLRDLTVHALDGVFRGAVDLNDFSTYRINGELNSVSIRSLMQMTGTENSSFAGAINGPVEITGSLKERRALKAGGRFRVTATQGGVPVQGFINAAFDSRRNSVQLGESYLTLPSTRLDFRGTFGEQLQIRAETKDLNDLRPALALFSSTMPDKLPLELKGGSALFQGTVSGPFNQARVAGQLTATSFDVQDQRVDRLAATLEATSSGVHVSSLGLGQDALRLVGSLDIVLSGWKLTDTSTVSGSLKVENARLRKLLTDAGLKLPIEGTVRAEAKVKGNAGEPQAELQLTVDKPEIYGEHFDRFRAQVRYQGAGVEVINGVAEAGKSRVLLAGTYQHPPNDYRNGDLKFDIATENWTLQQVENIRKARPGLTGELNLQARGHVRWRKGEILPETLDGDLALSRLGFDGRQIGDFSIDARTTGRLLSMGMAGDLRGSKITGKANLQLEGEYSGAGEVTMSPMKVSTLQDMISVTRGAAPMPVEGTIEGHLMFSGPVKRPELMRARIELPRLTLQPARRALTAAQIAELSLRNQGPIVAEYDGKLLHVRSAHFVGRETDLQLTGAISTTDKSGYDLRMNGSFNLGVLQGFHEDLVSSGAAVVNASIRGSLQDPLVNGRMELKDASLYLADLPNGIDRANGTILFDKRRATIEKLTANTGGGDLSLSGFVGFGVDLIYQLQARADRVRIRYPEGVSTTANANLSLTGSASKSLLSGVVTVVREGFNPRTDIGSLLVSAPIPVVPPASQSEFLRNLQFDVRIETVPNLQFQTALTSDLQADADLRLRGSAAKPAVLGRIVVSQGEIQFFGNKYTINRGEIGFFNPVRIEPVLDLDLETQVRGVRVNINFNGPLQKLNVSYRSDPPLQSTEIIALLAVGRAPGSNSALASSQTITNQSFMQTGNNLLGQAVAAPLSSRLQRFFGVSRLKIDPQLTGLSAVPQARLTIEQQISRDVTLTYVSNLAQANQQIIRLQWDISQSWSVVAVREENGVFGVDFFFKKRLR